MASPMPEYDDTAGFPQVHIDAFKRVAQRMKLVISSRELNPLCTDLVLENYAAKGFHIKAKTCDWGPMAGFVPADPRFTKASQNPEKQKEDLGKAFEAGARATPLFISQARYNKLVERRLIVVRAVRDVTGVEAMEAYAGSRAAGGQRFLLVKTREKPPGGEVGMWGIYYSPNSSLDRASGQQLLPGTFPTAPGMTPVMGMVNPDDAHGALGVRSAVAGDYDLWCIFPHTSAEDIGLGNRAMPLRATMRKDVTPFLRQQAAAAGLIFRDAKEKAQMADKLEDPHLGNISSGILKVRTQLNAECKTAGYTSGRVVQHSDYGANPFGDIDYPLIFFIPEPPSFASASVEVARNLGDLQAVLRQITKLGYAVKLNPAWTVPLF